MPNASEDDGVIRTFATGANRNSDKDKFDFEGFLSPLVIERFGQYMHKHRHLEDGSLRDSDNWMKGIPQDVLMKSGWRHFLDWWLLHRGHNAREGDIEEALCGLLFNAMAYLHNRLSVMSQMARVLQHEDFLVKALGDALREEVASAQDETPFEQCPAFYSRQRKRPFRYERLFCRLSKGHPGEHSSMESDSCREVSW